jgi:hypothetical protein
MDDEDTVRLTDITRPVIIEELKQYSDKHTPDNSLVFKNMLNGKVVKLSELHRSMEHLSDEVFKNLDTDKGPKTKELSRLEDLLAELGSQL